MISLLFALVTLQDTTIVIHADSSSATLEARALPRVVSEEVIRFYNAPGTTRLVIDRDREVLVGATFTGADVSEFVHAATIAIVGKVPLEDLWHAVPSFPTRSEVWLRLLEKYGL